jgi:hypothetical protein
VWHQPRLNTLVGVFALRPGHTEDGPETKAKGAKESREFKV